MTPIGYNTDYATDAQRARRFRTLVDDGLAASLPELALRYAISNDALSTTEIGIATLDELRLAASAVDKGPLPADALTAIKAIQQSFADDASGPA